VESRDITDRETANRADIIIRTKKEKMRTVRCGNTSRQKYHAKGSRKETKIKEHMCRDTRNVAYGLCD
jgi:hypothetical protein